MWRQYTRRQRNRSTKLVEKLMCVWWQRSSKANHVYCPENPAHCGMLVVSTLICMYVNTLTSSMLRMSVLQFGQDPSDSMVEYIVHDKLTSTPSRLYGSIILSHRSSFYSLLDPFLNSSLWLAPSHFKISCNNMLLSTSWSSKRSLLFTLSG